VTSILEELAGVFRTQAPLNITKGKIHEYLEMTFDFTKDGAMEI
jgi:hypothetical protein